MKKELIIIGIIIIVIITAHAVTQIYTQNFFDMVSKDLDNIEEKIFSQNFNQDEINDEIQNVKNKWRKKYDYFACFVEHDELEKVETQLISITTNAKVEDYDKCVDEIEKCKFIIKHIEDKDSLKIVNIF